MKYTGRYSDCTRRRFECGAGVAVGMSGGVDSSAAACILHELGFEVVGVTLRFYCYSKPGVPVRACCSEASLRRARDLCKRLGVPHHVVDAEDDFRRTVIGDFIREYERGRTPNPCVVCNEKVKFPMLARVADWLGFRDISTGHYAGLGAGPGGPVFLTKAADARKDQSYFLYRIPIGILKRTIFPLSRARKREVGRMAGEYGFPERNEGESQDVCFLPGGDLHGFLAERAFTRPGRVVDTSGNFLGDHKGIAYYTVGQRRGFGIAGKRPMYVKSIDAVRNTIVLAPERELYSGSAVCAGLRLRRKPPEGNITAKIRYRHPPAAVAGIERRRGRLVVRFRKPQRAVTPGQSLVLYSDDKVIGGGIIETLGGEGSL